MNNGEAVTPVLLAGGTGQRLWPVSRASHPKQFSKFFDDRTLFQKSYERFLSEHQNIKFNRPIIVTNDAYRFIVAEQLREIGAVNPSIILEPYSRNTGPAVLAASFFAANKDPEGILLVCPTDHSISNEFEFHLTVSRGVDALKNGRTIIFGVTPLSPETGYGYIRTFNSDSEEIFEVFGFTEKPEYQEALKFLEDRSYFWNSGIYLFRAKDILDTYRRLEPKMFSLVEKAFCTGENDLGFFRLNELYWEECNSVSIDFAVTEKINDLFMVKANFDWNDLGDWGAVLRESDTDGCGVATSGDAMAINCKDTLIRSDEPKKILVGLGLSNIVAVATQDAVLVAHKDYSQQVRTVVAELDKMKRKEAFEFPLEFRPWGRCQILTKAENFILRKVTVSPDCQLSLQRHRYRSEHWIVTSGKADIFIDGERFQLSSGHSAYIPAGAVHQLQNNESKTDLEIIEVQIGLKLDEGDIERFS